MFGAKKEEPASSDESVIANNEVVVPKSVNYAYDAYQEKLEKEVPNGGSGSGSGSRAEGRVRKSSLREPVLGQSLMSTSEVEAR